MVRTVCLAVNVISVWGRCKNIGLSASLPYFAPTTNALAEVDFLPTNLP
jgi:hypothetical protein